MRSRALCRGKISSRYVPGRQSVAIISLHVSQKGPRTGKSPLPGKIRTPCIRNELALAGYARHASEMSWLWQDMRAMHPKSPANRRWRIHHANILPGRSPFRCTNPSNHARRADLAIRRRTARAIATTAPPLWAAERGAGGFLSGGVTLPKECVVLWGVERWRQSWHQ